MRRILLGGLLSLGAFAPAALAQQPATSPPTRAATLGKPVALPNPAPTPALVPSDPDVTQAGLFRGSSRPTVTYSPNLGTPVISQPPGSNPLPTPMPIGPDGKPMVPPTPPGGTVPPMVTESRDPTGRIPNGMVIPSICPDDYACPTPQLDDPLHAPRLGLHRLHSCGRNWVSAEVLLWWNRSMQVPPLVTTSSAPANGVIGQGDTQVLVGGGSFGDTFNVGGRVGGGHWFDDNGCRGFDWRIFWVGPSTSSFTASVPPYTLLARPFNNVNPTTTVPALGPTAEVVAGPGVANGVVSTQLRSTIWGAEANYRRYLLCKPCGRLDLLVGYRYLDLHDDLTITEAFNRVPGSDMTIGTPAQSGVISDRFHTENHFHGGQIGLASTQQRGRWSLDTRATIAFGTVFQSADVNGSQTLTFANGMTTSTSGGLLAVPGANIGHFSQSRFAVVPEIGVNLGYQVTSHVKVFVGYNFLYLSSAVRPGDVINTNIDAARVPNLLPAGATPILPPQPTPHMSTNGYFIQGINFGLIYRW